MTLSEKIKLLCTKQGITLYRIEKDCGFGNGSIMKWEKSSPKVENVIKVANYFNVSIDYLLGRAENSLPIKRPEYALAEKFATDYKKLLTDKNFQDITAMCNEITDEQRALICGYVAGLLQNWGVNVQSILQN